jgi:hypothetical protein
MVNTDLLTQLQRERVLELCHIFFPNGKKDGQEWKLGDVSGAPGGSLGVQLTGPKAGLWHDRATDEGGDIVKLLQLQRNLTFPQAAEMIERTAGISLHADDGQSCSSIGAQKPKVEPRSGPKLEGIEPCSQSDLWQIAKLRSIPLGGLRLAHERKLLFAYQDP